MAIKSASAKLENSIKVGEQTWAKFIKESFNLSIISGLSGATDSALGVKAFFVTSVGSNPIMTKKYFFDFFYIFLTARQ